MKFTISPSKVRGTLAATVILLIFVGVALRIARQYLGWDFAIVPLFDLGTDNTIPTWYSSIALLACSLALAVIALHTPNQPGRFLWHWIMLGIIFLGLSLDEVARIHETIGAAISSRFIGKTHGVLYYSWVIPGSVFVLLFGVSYLKFLAHLPRATCWRMIFAGGLFVGGAIGVEMMNARNNELNGSGTIAGILGTALEEFLEMIGIVIFLHALLAYLAQHIFRSNTLAIEIGGNTRENTMRRQPVPRRRPRRYRYVLANRSAELVKPR